MDGIADCIKPKDLSSHIGNEALKHSTLKGRQQVHNKQKFTTNLASLLAVTCAIGLESTKALAVTLAVTFAVPFVMTFAAISAVEALAQTDSATTLAHPAGGGTMDTGTPTTTTDAQGGTTSGTQRDSKKMQGKKGNRAGKKAMGKDQSGTEDAVNEKDASRLGQ